MAVLIGDNIECLSCKNDFVVTTDNFVSKEKLSNLGHALCPKCGTRNSVTIKRNKEIKVRLTQSEHDDLLSRMSGGELASWIRNVCLGKKTERRNPPPKVDPQLLRQLSGIGNNLNQLARQVNSGTLGAGDTVQILTALAAIEDELKKVNRNAS